MSNRFYTILIVPEKTSRVRRLVVPSWLFKGAAFSFAVLSLVSIIMMLDYWYVMNQINENKQLKMENRRLRQQVQVFKNKMTTVESTMDRIKSFATRLKVITNIEDRGGLLQSLNSQTLPEASSSTTDQPAQPAATAKAADPSPTPATASPPPGPVTSEAVGVSGSSVDERDPQEMLLRKDYALLDNQFTDLNRETLYVEQMLQDQYELLADQKSFLAALPTRKPALGYYTSGFGIRRAPFGGRVKMHEGLDIANRPGTPVKAPADGIVTFADVKSGYGQTLILDHGYGLETWYAHTRKILVNRGQKVHRGDTVALLGNTGRSTGPHLHYEVRVHGTPINPLSYILEY